MMQPSRRDWVAPRARMSRPAMESQPETRSIAGVFTPRLIARLHREGFEGTLRLHAGGATRVIYFRRGDIASAASNAEDDRLHNLLIREGRLTGPQVEMARSRQRPGASLGKVLIELGFLTPSELLQGARRQVRQILAACFALTEGTWQSVAGPLGPEVTNLGLPARRLIFDALMEAGDRRAIVREMGSMESIYQPTASLGDALATLRLDPAMEEVARMIDGRATLREISSRTRLDDFTVSRIVLAFDILGLAALANQPEPTVASRAGRLIPVESDDDSAAEVAVQPVEASAPAVMAARLATAAPISPQPSQWREPPAAPEQAHASPAAPEAGGETVRLSAPALPVAARPAGDRELPLPSARETVPAPPPTPAAPIPSPAAPTGDTTAFATDTEEESAPPAASREAEPPSFPRDELPAFADGPREPEDIPVWTINPETGEKVHEGPIELTFDGPMTPARSGRSRARIALAGGLAAIVVAALALSFYLQSNTGEPAGAPEEAAAELPLAAGTAPAEDAPASKVAPATVHDAGGKALDGGGTAAAEAGGGAPSETPEPAAPLPPAPQPVAPEPAVPQPVAEAEVAAVPAAGSATGSAPDGPIGSPDARLAPGQALLDAGDVTGAAAAFRATLADLPADSVTLQLMIACEESSVRKARAVLSKDDPIFVTPFTLQGRACHRILWGLYPDREAAQTGAASVPPYFTGAGVKPVAVSIGRLRGPS